MSSTASTNPPKRVMLWCTPRSLSAAFLRGMSNVEDFQVWYEPYLMVQKSQAKVKFAFANSADHPRVPSHFYSMNGERNTYDWVQQQLEGDFPGKRLVFVKEMVEGIHGHYDRLPRGYQHTFLIRHPLKAFASHKKLLTALYYKEDMDQYPENIVPSGYFYKEMVEFVAYVKKAYDPKPLIIDADDLQSNKVGIMKEFCKRIGVPYDDRIVHWNGDVVFDNWMMARELMPIFGMSDIHKKATTGSTGISDVTPLPSRSDLPEDVLKLADASLKYYEMLYAEKLNVT